ncbi:MAG: putative toxin-antitoxin system toxin component, PIN family [Acidobacteria bacterium]|nr:putative toxin-antitoxin system toxin component, PIN family [Acidobacteriota bacterium]MYH50369.1 putative toxin-antitoxin system toxin component, PIN family [Gammaproteobacteria bacterium]MYK80854.1 putative toxin-antitoxin system toxin component, PIN family [Acidobacteriota bacterium]
MTRFVFDINALISAFLIEESVPSQALRSALDRGVVLVSVPLVTTLAGVLRRPKFDRYLTLHEREALVAAFVASTHMIEIAERIRACRDPDDDAILELAVNGNAAAIITGDPDLLVLNPFRGIQILAPADFVRQTD